MDISFQLEVLKEAYSEDAELGQVLTKLLEAALGQYQLRLKRYEDDLHKFEDRYHMQSPAFHEQFEAGELGDGMELFEWAGLFELQQDLISKIQRLEMAL
jgi:hypothetical protein